MLFTRLVYHAPNLQLLSYKEYIFGRFCDMLVNADIIIQIDDKHSIFTCIYFYHNGMFARLIGPLHIEIMPLASRYLFNRSRPRKWRSYDNWCSLWNLCKNICDPFYKHGLTLIQAWISNFTYYKVWYEITYPSPNSNYTTVEVWKC